MYQTERIHQATDPFTVVYLVSILSSKANTMTGFNYLGTIDDVVQRYPWRFKITQDLLNHSLATQLIDGRPLLINDGYLVLHPVAQSAIMDRENLLWTLISEGFVNVLSRGYGVYGLHDMPEKMQSTIESFDLLVNGRIDGAPAWNELKKQLKKIDQHLNAFDASISWPSFDSGSGFIALADRILQRQSTARSLGLGWSIKTRVLHDFLRRFIDRMQGDKSGPRNYWEKLAKEFADRPGYTSRPDNFVLSMMNLVNEMYHYNFGIMLAAETDSTISVETQTSPAFDDLLVVKDVLIEQVKDIPRLRIPRSILTAPPAKLGQLLHEDKAVGKARLEWLDKKHRFNPNENSVSGPSVQEMRDAAEEYSRRLSEHLHLSIKYSSSESFLGFCAANVTSDIRGAATAGIGVAAGAALESLAAGFGAGAIAYGTAYGLSMVQKKYVGTVTEKYRLWRLEKEILPPKLLQQSKAMIERIKHRRVPSAIVIDQSIARELAKNIDRFRA